MSNIKKLIDHIDWDKLLDEVEADRKVEVQKRQNFWVSERFKDILLILKQDTLSGPVAHNPYKEYVCGNVTNEEFCNVFDCLFDSRVVTLKIIQEPGPFETESVEYEGLKFIQVHGQGTALIVQNTAMIVHKM